VAYPGAVPHWATTANDVGAAPADQTVEGELYLNLQDLPGATALAAAVSDPASPGYRHWISPQEWIGRFSPPQSVYDSLVAFLKAAGFTITGTPESRLFVVFRGTAAQFGAAFGAALHLYGVAGHRLAAPSAAPSLPGNLASSVSGMELDQGRTLTRPGLAGGAAAGSAPAAASSAAAVPAAVEIPCSAYYGEHRVTLPPAYGQTSFPTGVCGYLPAQLRSAYGISSPLSTVVAADAGPRSPSGLSGRGQTVAIIDAYASPTVLEDVNTYSARHGEPPLTDAHYAQIVPKEFTDEAACGFPSGWQVEQTLDVEAVHGMAPAADIRYVGGSNCAGGIDVAMSQVLDGRLATIVSNSYGNIGEAIPPDVLQGQENLHLQAVAEGIGLYFSSGDSGDEAAAVGTPQPDYPASSPWVTSVGGTATGIAEDGTVAVETGWGTHRDLVVQDATGAAAYDQPLPGEFRSGAGGGRSTVFPQPGYQRGVVPASLAAGRRVSPDIAADASPITGFLIGIRPIVDDTTLATGPFREDRYGGTSLSSPLVAAQVALVQQATGRTLGFANPALYAVYRAAPQFFRDVRPAGSPFALADRSRVDGNPYLITEGLDTSLDTGTGYDDVTGLGAVSLELLQRMATG
jgi:subtilase family serine protease